MARMARICFTPRGQLTIADNAKLFSYDCSGSVFQIDGQGIHQYVIHYYCP